MNVYTFSTASILLPLICGVLKYKHLNKVLKLLFYFFCFSTLVELACLYFYLRKENNLWIINIFELVEFYIYSYVCCYFINSKASFWIGVGLQICFSIAWIISMFYENELHINNDLINAIEAVVLMILAGFALLKITNDAPVNIFVAANFLMISSILLYFAGNLLIFSLSEYILGSNSKILGHAWKVHSFWNIITNILFSIGFLCTSKKKTYF